VFHAFVRDSKGVITLFDAPNAGTANGQGPAAFAINPSGLVTGWYLDTNYTFHGFVWTP
jgi:hypothetical protein